MLPIAIKGRRPGNRGLFRLARSAGPAAAASPRSPGSGREEGREFTIGTPRAMMAATNLESGFDLDVRRNRLALVVADANWFSTDNLFREVEQEGVATLLLRCQDFRNAWNRGQRPWDWNTPLV